MEYWLGTAMRHEFLSHSYGRVLPVLGGTTEIDTLSIKAVARGDSSNVMATSLQSHWGTHMDAPRHFFDNGTSISDYPASFFVFTRPTIVTVSLNPSEILQLAPEFESLPEETDLLLLKSGWSAHRADSVYACNNPGVSPDFALFIRKQYPKLRAIGIDWISISANTDRPLGREAHRAFLNPEGINCPVLLIEDMSLTPDLTNLVEVTAIPLRIEGFDSAPCTVIGGFSD